MKRFVGLILLLLICFNVGCKKTQIPLKTETVYKIENLYNGDAKLLPNNDAVTSVDGKLTFIDAKGKIIKSYDNIFVNWCDVWKDQIIIYGNAHKEIGICQIDDSYNIVSNQVIINTEADLAIDPAICEVEDEYYFTVTLINGNINNADEDKQNGIYTVKLYKLDSSFKWEEVSTVLTDNANIEDIDLNYWDGKFYLTYEKETYDKKNSSLNLMISENTGKNWGQNIILIDENADNEPAAFEKTDNHYRLYYSSDIENPGLSYEGAKVYIQEFDEQMKKVGEAVCINLENNDGCLLYDVKKTENEIYYLFTTKYITESNLVLERGTR